MDQKISEIVDHLKSFSEKGMKKIRENWRLLLVAAIVVIISLNSSWNASNVQPNDKEKESQNVQTEQKNSEKENTNSENQTNVAQAKEEAKNDSGDIISQTAEKSEGLTHLARKALKQELNASGETLTSEQKIYAEDYIVKKTGPKPLEIGETIKFQKQLINDGITKAKGLNQKQIENLSKYVPLVKNLN